ncbi:MAG: rhomboid family intramembrane serine protease [Anaerolineaceae bacterium]|jgi:rhomboid protease GluP
MSDFPNHQDQPEDQSAQVPPTRQYMVGPKLRKPVLTYILIGFTALIYLGQVILEQQYGVDLLFVLLGKINPAILQGQFWRLITPAFLHASPLHLLSNMYALFILGRSNESINGPLRFGLLYFVSAFGGNVLSFVLGKYNSLGASTAMFGLLTAEAMFVWQNRDFFANRGRRNLINIVTILALNLMIGLSSGGVIDNWGHLGGAVAGLFFAFMAGTRWKIERVDGLPAFVDQRTNKDALLAFGLVFLAFAVIASIPFFSK